MKLHRTGQGPALVLLHCLGIDRGLWRLAAPGLDAEYTCIGVDFPGHGSAGPAAGAYTIEDLSTQLADLLAQHGIGRAHVAGISLGGLVAQHLAATRPALVDRLVLIDTTPRYIDEARANWAVRAATARAEGVAAMTETLLRIWFTDAAVAAGGPAVEYVRNCFARCSGEGYALACEALAAADLRPLVPAITARTLVVCGEDDIPPFRDAARWLQACIPGATLAWLAPARHASILEQPGQFTQALRAFLAA